MSAWRGWCCLCGHRGGDAVQHEVTNEDLAGGIEVTVGDVVAPELWALEHLAAAQLVIDLTARAARLRCVRFIADDHSAVRFPLSTMQEKLASYGSAGEIPEYPSPERSTKSSRCRLGVHSLR